MLYNRDMGKKSQAFELSSSPGVLSKREFDVIRLLGSGNRTEDIARVLGISERTVELYRYKIHMKLKLDTPAEIVFYCIKHGIVDSKGSLSDKTIKNFRKEVRLRSGTSLSLR